jgi:predicted nucleotidyltransferase
MMDRKDSIVSILKDVFKNESARYNMQTAFLYGSRAKGFPKFDSDVDVAIFFDDEPAEGELFERLTAISLVLSEMLGLEVNVIPIYRNFRHPILYYNAIVMGIPVYIKDFMEYAHLINEAIYQAEDFGLFGLEWQRTLTRKNLEVIQHA